MKRSAIKSKTPLRAKSQPARKAPLKKVNRKRAARRRAEDFGPQAELCRRLPCCSCDAMLFRTVLARRRPGWPFDPVDPHHEPTRARGGKDHDTLPLCRPCHRRRHDRGPKTFWGAVDYQAIKAELRAWVAELTGGAK
jgi:hypothetical protein